MAHFHMVDEKDVITVAAETPIDATISAAAAFTRGAPRQALHVAIILTASSFWL